MGPMHDPHTQTDIDIESIRIYEGDELVFDGSDPTSYVVLQTAADIDAFFAQITAGTLDSPRDYHRSQGAGRP